MKKNGNLNFRKEEEVGAATPGLEQTEEVSGLIREFLREFPEAIEITASD